MYFLFCTLAIKCCFRALSVRRDSFYVGFTKLTPFLDILTYKNEALLTIGERHFKFFSNIEENLLDINIVEEDKFCKLSNLNVFQNIREIISEAMFLDDKLTKLMTSMTTINRIDELKENMTKYIDVLIIFEEFYVKNIYTKKSSHLFIGVEIKEIIDELISKIHFIQDAICKIKAFCSSLTNSNTIALKAEKYLKFFSLQKNDFLLSKLNIDDQSKSKNSFINANKNFNVDFANLNHFEDIANNLLPMISFPKIRKIFEGGIKINKEEEKNITNKILEVPEQEKLDLENELLPFLLSLQRTGKLKEFINYLVELIKKYL